MGAYRPRYLAIEMRGIDARVVTSDLGTSVSKAAYSAGLRQSSSAAHNVADCLAWLLRPWLAKFGSGPLGASANTASLASIDAPCYGHRPPVGVRSGVAILGENPSSGIDDRGDRGDRATLFRGLPVEYASSRWTTSPSLANPSRRKDRSDSSGRWAAPNQLHSRRQSVSSAWNRQAQPLGFRQQKPAENASSARCAINESIARSTTPAAPAAWGSGIGTAVAATNASNGRGQGRPV